MLLKEREREREREREGERERERETRQDKTRQDKTSQDKTRQNKTRRKNKKSLAPWFSVFVFFCPQHTMRNLSLDLSIVLVTILCALSK